MRTVKISSSKFFTAANSLVIRYESWAPEKKKAEERIQSKYNTSS